MTTAALAEALKDIRLKEEHITEELISTLEKQHGFTPAEINEESFGGYFDGIGEYEAGRAVAREFSMMHDLQSFLDTAIDWEKAWDNLKKEGYILIPANEPNTWLLFSKIHG